MNRIICTFHIVTGEAIEGGIIYAVRTDYEFTGNEKYRCADG